MLKRLLIAAAILAGLAGHVQAAGTVPGFSLVPQFDLTGKIAPGCRLFVIQAGTVSTPQNAYQDSGLTLLQPNPMLCDAAGRLPQWFVADGNIKLRLTDKNGVQIFSQDGLLVVGASSGGGGGSPIDPTTISATGDVKSAYGTSILSGWVRANGRTIGSSTSGATERANADCQALFVYLWGSDANLVVSGGRGASAAADWAANKTIALPDFRGRTIAGLDDMGNSAAGRLTASYFGAGPTTLGSSGSSGESTTLTLAQLPTGITSANASQAIAVNQSVNGTGNVRQIYGANGTFANANANGGASFVVPAVSLGGAWEPISNISGTNSISVTSSNTSGAAHRTVQPTILTTYYIKL